MGACTHAQEGALVCPPSGNVVECFRALLVTAKRSGHELFMHYFTTCCRLLAALPPDPHWGSRGGPWILLGDFCSQTPNLLTPGKNLRAPIGGGKDY